MIRGYCKDMEKMLAGGNIVMGIDPGIANTGYGIVTYKHNRFKYITHGTITTDCKKTQGERLLQIFNGICSLIDTYKPSEAGIETLYFAKNVTSALSVSEARGVVLLAFANFNISVSEYAPNTIKKAVTGVALAEKKQVQEAVKLLLGLKEIPKPDHAADALAAAITKINLNNFKPVLTCGV